jgi:hypothetical protein
MQNWIMLLLHSFRKRAWRVRFVNKRTNLVCYSENTLLRKGKKIQQTPSRLYKEVLQKWIHQNENILSR